MNVQHCFEKCASLWFLAYDIISNDCHGNDDDDGGGGNDNPDIPWYSNGDEDEFHEDMKYGLW